MRRRLRPQLPLLARVYGLSPDEVEALPYAELQEFLQDLDRVLKQQESEVG